MSPYLRSLALIGMVVIAASCSDDANTPGTPAPELPTVTDGLIMYLPLDGSVKDAKGLIADAEITVSGGPTYTVDRNGKADRALLLDGADDIVRLGATIVLQQYPLTWSAWLRPRFTQQQGLTVPLGKYLHPSGDGLGFFWENGKFGGLYTVDNFGRFCRAEATFPLDGDWHHVLMTVDGVRMRLYIDGSIVSEWEWTGSAMTATTIERLTIGNVSSVHPTQPPTPYHGDIDNIAIYARVLTPEEIVELATQ